MRARGLGKNFFFFFSFHYLFIKYKLRRTNRNVVQPCALRLKGLKSRFAIQMAFVRACVEHTNDALQKVDRVLSVSQ